MRGAGHFQRCSYYACMFYHLIGWLIGWLMEFYVLAADNLKSYQDEY